MRKKTQEEFEKDVSTANPNIQVVGKYINNATKVKVKCIECGRIWDAVPTKIIVPYRCALCNHQKVFCSFLTENDLVALDAYQDNFTKVLVQCKKCGHRWNAVPKELKKDPRCPNCSEKGNRKKWTTEKLINELQKRNPSVVLEEEYTDYEKKIRCSCRKCGYTFAQSAHQLLAGKGCPKCNGHRSWTTEEFTKQLEERNPNIIATGFEGIKNKVHCKCRVCGYEWTPAAYDLLKSHNCPQCSGHARINYLQFKEQFQLEHPTIELLAEDVEKASTLFKCRCKRCGNIWLTNVSRLKAGNGCKLCNYSATSFMEQAILQSFRIRLGTKEVLSRNKKIVGKELDIYIPSREIAFEPGSWFFHKKIVQKDSIKRELCAKQGIRLITIYDCYTEQAAPFPDNCITYKQGLGEKNNRVLLRQLVDYLFEQSAVAPLITDNEWVMVQKYATEHSMRQSPEEIIKDINKVNPDIIILSKPTRSQEKVLCHCKKCGYEWPATPANLKMGIGCPMCGGTKKLSQEEFEQQLRESNPKIVPLEEYVHIQYPILFRCNECGYEWKGRPRALLREGSMCPACKKRKRLTSLFTNRGIPLTASDIKQITIISKRDNPNKKYTTKEFGWLISRLNPSVEVIGEYININETITCKCKNCGNIWNPKAEHILNGHGCPNCKKKRNIVGESNMMNCGMTCTVIKDNGAREISVQFEDGTIVNNKSRAAFRRGHIANPSIRRKKRTNKEYYG